MRIFTILSLLITLLPSLLLARSWTPEDGCPTEIHTVISSDPCERKGRRVCDDSPRFHTMVDVHVALSTCPNITSLDLRVTALGCSEWPDRWNFPFKPAGGETYPRLKILRLEGYRLDNTWREPWHRPQFWYGELSIRVEDGLKWLWSGQWKTWLQWRLLPRKQQEKSHFALWLDAMDWSGIEELMIDGITPEVLNRLPGHLPSLKKLETGNATFIRALPNNTLTHLTFIGKSEYQDLPAILDRQGKSLQNLEFRCPELRCPTFLDDFDVSILPKRTSNLTHVSINISRNGTWPFETLETLASIPTLQSADLYMNLQSSCKQQFEENPWRYDEYERSFGKEKCIGKDRYQRPFLEDTGALDLFKHMREKKVGDDLTDVTFRVGDWTRGWDGPLYWPVWLDGKTAKVVCKADLESEADGWCVVEKGEKYWEGEMDDEP